MAAAQPKAEAFLSYAHLDDRACGGQISRLREQLALSVSAALGREFEIFQDRDGIAWGQRWSKRLDEALGQALFLIPVLTPSYFNSKFCRAELEQFLELERGADRDDLILPIYFVTARPFEDRSDPLAAAVKDRQYRDWRNFWHRPIKSPGVMRAIAQLAREIEAAIHRSVPAVVGERISPARQDARGPSVLSLEDFKARLPIVDVVGRTVRLTRRGRQHLGLCPFHKEKTPSFYVYEDDGHYHCFGCGAHGNAIDFVMATERLGFPDALQRLAELTGLPRRRGPVRGTRRRWAA